MALCRLCKVAVVAGCFAPWLLLRLAAVCSAATAASVPARRVPASPLLPYGPLCGQRRHASILLLQDEEVQRRHNTWLHVQTLPYHTIRYDTIHYTTLQCWNVGCKICSWCIIQSRQLHSPQRKVVTVWLRGLSTLQTPCRRPPF